MRLLQACDLPSILAAQLTTTNAATRREAARAIVHLTGSALAVQQMFPETEVPKRMSGVWDAKATMLVEEICVQLSRRETRTHNDLLRALASPTAYRPIAYHEIFRIAARGLLAYSLQ